MKDCGLMERKEEVEEVEKMMVVGVENVLVRDGSVVDLKMVCVCVSVDVGPWWMGGARWRRTGVGGRVRTDFVVVAGLWAIG